LFANCDLSGADFSSSDLSGAELARSILFNAILEDAKMTDTDLRGGQLSGFDPRPARGWRPYAVSGMKRRGGANCRVAQRRRLNRRFDVLLIAPGGNGG
jgi:hypothetical protein